MTNAEAIKALTDIKVYAQSNALDAVEYAIEVLEKLEKAGISNPLETNLGDVIKITSL